MTSLIMRPYQRGGKDYYWFALGGANLDDSKVTSDRNALVDSFYEIIGKRYIEFGELRACTPWTANVRMVNKFSEGRVFVVGDAAHVHSPTGGQGLNSGVQDSINLGWKLSLVQNGLADRSLLDSYSQERLPIIAAMLDKTTNLMNKTFHKSTSGIGAGGWLRDWELKQFGINYRGGPLLVDERYRDLDEPVDPYRSGHDGTAHAGDRAPSAPGLVVPGEETRRCLYDLFDVVAHTILVFCRPTSSLHLEVAKVLSGYNGRLVKAVIIHPQDAAQTSLETKSVQMFIDTEGHAYKHYKVQKDEESVVVVRPDAASLRFTLPTSRSID
ncbi:hypothetical protein V5O48_010332 [Marasmius crinis-equi]|uniref:FAD-binding domain-containing protein n=1 Tax=Marasmius crinis-equi TaxID=585013 RepID=A0ABR3F8N0_9AGAR